MAQTNLVSIQVTDDAGNVGNVLLSFPATSSLANIQSFVDGFCAHLDAVTGAKITKASVSLALTLPAGLKASALPDTPVQWGANFAFDVADSSYRYTVRVPAIDQGLVTGGVVDTSPQFVQDFINDFVIGDGVVAPSDRYANDITAFIEAASTFRKS